MKVARRNFLKGAASGAAGTALAGGVLIGGARADNELSASGGPDTASAYPFHDVHQSGVLTPGPADKQGRSRVSPPLTAWLRTRPA